MNVWVAFLILCSVGMLILWPQKSGAQDLTDDELWVIKQAVDKEWNRRREENGGII